MLPLFVFNTKGVITGVLFLDYGDCKFGLWLFNNFGQLLEEYHLFITSFPLVVTIILIFFY